MSLHPCATYDFTHPAEGLDPSSFIDYLQPIFKSWVFQLEEGDSGYLHFQGRGSLFKKRRFSELKKILATANLAKLHVSPTVTANLGSAFYCMKLDTRIDGPWSDKDSPPVYVPRQYRDITPYPWQQSVLDSANTFDSRTVNLVYDPEGSRGKTTIAVLCALHHKGIRIPPINDHEKLLATCCDILLAKEERSPGPVFIDLPRFMDKTRLHGLISACEEIKNGHCYDLRYHYKEWYFDSPPVWVFTNTMIPIEALSADRWRYWEICPFFKTLKNFRPPTFE